MDGGSNKPKCHLKAQKPRTILYLGIPYTPPCRHQYVCMKLCPLMASITQMPPFPFTFLRYPGVENFNEIALSRMFKKQFCVSPFLAKIRKIKMAAIFGEGKIFGKLQRVHSLDTLWVENFDEIALSRTVKEIEASSCFAIFGKNSKIQNGRHFWGGENFLKIAKSTFLRYPVGRKFRRNLSISHG